MPGSCRNSALAAVPPTMPAYSAENSKRSWLLTELYVEIHLCPISPFPGSPWETAKTFWRKAVLYDLFTCAVVSASSRGTVYWHNHFAVTSETLYWHANLVLKKKKVHNWLGFFLPPFFPSLPICSRTPTQKRIGQPFTKSCQTFGSC